MGNPEQMIHRRALAARNLDKAIHRQVIHGSSQIYTIAGLIGGIDQGCTQSKAIALHLSGWSYSCYSKFLRAFQLFRKSRISTNPRPTILHFPSQRIMSLSLGLNSVPFPSEAAPSPLVIRPSALHRRRGVDLGMALRMPPPTQFGYGYAVGNSEAATAAAAVFTTDTNNNALTVSNNPRTGRLGYSSGLFGSAASANATSFWSPASAVVGTKGPLQPHVSNLPRRKPTVRRD
ncbi:hypothetical protein F5050DRAFT_1777879 [Lentinula boryana]|uniref:Uncharacterized protein n=1 Tax=Lentinula boryana TaxID=40481 RepID=A0ABQ8Q622_9AGAR|nr:hypothetical protein F5050DRAFT_1777879 [Lentinula boryana]